MNGNRCALTENSVLSRVVSLARLGMAGCLLIVSAAATAQSVAYSFDGDRGPGFAACESGVTHCDRPDMNVAVNGKQIVQVTWQNARVYDYAGKLLRSISMADLIRSTGLDPTPPKSTGPFEPHIVFNEFIGRWIIAVTCLNDCVLVSASSDPRGKWGGVYLSCGDRGPCLNFDPALHLGYDKNGMYVCGAHLGDDNPNTIPNVAYDCFAVFVAELRGIADGRAPAHINRQHAMPLDVMPAVDHNRAKSRTSPGLFLSKSCPRSVRGGCQNAVNDPFDWVIDSFTWNSTTGTGTYGTEQRVKTDAGSTRSRWLYNIPCCTETLSFPQRGNDTIRVRAAESHRLADLVQFGAHLFAAMPSGPCTYDCGDQGMDENNVMFWVDLDCSRPQACTVSQTGKIAGEFSPEFPTVGVDAHGNIGIVAASSTANTDLSLLLWTRRASDPPNTFQGPMTIVAGTQPWTCMNRRSVAELANPAGISTLLDPADGSLLWTTHQWSNDADRCVWNTRIIGYRITPHGKSH